jgi:hypothetical protein
MAPATQSCLIDLVESVLSREQVVFVSSVGNDANEGRGKETAGQQKRSKQQIANV